MAIFNLKKRSAASSSPVGAIVINSPGVLAGSGYHALCDAPEVASAIWTIAELISSAPIHLMENGKSGDIRVRDQLSRKIDIDPWSLGTRQLWMHWIVETILVQGEAVVIPKTAGNLIADLIPAPNFKISSRALYSYSLKELSEIALNMRNAGLMTGNEGRKWLDLPPKDSLDELVMLENYIPTNRLGDQKKLNEIQKEEPENV